MNRELVIELRPRSVRSSSPGIVVIVGFQAQRTLGRRSVERRAKIRIFGVEREPRAEVVVMNGFSAHADRNELLAFAESVRARGALRDVVLVHGEPAAQAALKDGLTECGFASVYVPSRVDIMRFWPPPSAARRARSRHAIAGIARYPA